MPVEQINALSQVAIGSLLIIAAIVFILRIPQNAESIKAIVLEVRKAAEQGYERVETTNNVLNETVRQLRDVSDAMLHQNERLENRYDALKDEFAEVKRTYEAQLKAKDEEIARLRAELERANEEKIRQAVEAAKSLTAKEEALQRALRERDDLKERIEALNRMQKAVEPDIKPAASEDGKTAAA